jgi:ABC-2 type transport system permease protein
VGPLLPNLATAIAAALIWIALVEGLIAQLLGDMAQWLPMASARALGNAPGPDLLPQLTGGLVLVAWTALVAIAATGVARRRDVA